MITTIRLPENLHRVVKLAAIHQKTSMAAIILKAITLYLEDNNDALSK